MNTHRPLWSDSELNTLFGSAAADVNGISIDSRTLEPGDLFVALSGDPGIRFGGGHQQIPDARDGHDFAAVAVDRGASCILAHRALDVPLPVINVPDTLDGLWQLGEAARARSNARVIAITGSAGKTTLRAWMESVLGEFGRTHASVGSLNNHWGVPLSLARMPGDVSFGVFEIGTNHPGEIAPLSKLVTPDISVLLNVLPAHIGNFPDMSALRQEKLSISDGLSDGGTFVLPNSLATQVSHPQLMTFGLDGGDVSGRLESVDAGLILHADVAGQRVSCRLPFGGDERAGSVLALLAVCLLLDLSPAEVAPHIEHLSLPGGRGNEITLGDFTLIDDSYNANPVSMGMSLDVLTGSKRAGRRIAFLGEMLELGELGVQAHQSMAEHTREIDQVYSFGTGFAGVDFPCSHAHFEEVAAFDIDGFVSTLTAGDTLLVKGSNRVFWQRGFVESLARAIRASSR